MYIYMYTYIYINIYILVSWIRTLAGTSAGKSPFALQRHSAAAGADRPRRRRAGGELGVADELSLSDSSALLLDVLSELLVSDLWQ